MSRLYKIIPMDKRADEEENSSTKGCMPGWTRVTWIVRNEYAKKINHVAYWDRKSIKDVVNEMLEDYLKDKIL